MKRVYHRYEKWEEVKAGMWESVTGKTRAKHLQQAIEFTGNAELYGEWMLNVITAWPISCEHNLTAIETNRKAWIGHAACCLAIGCPEDITRHAWGFLTQDQQDKANDKAQFAIEQWEAKYLKQNEPMLKNMEIQGIFELV